MRLIAKHEVWVANVSWKGRNYLIVDTRHPALPPYSGAQVAHLQEGDTLLFAQLPTDGSNPYQVVMDEYGEHFTLELT